MQRNDKLQELIGNIKKSANGPPNPALQDSLKADKTEPLNTLKQTVTYAHFVNRLNNQRKPIEQEDQKSSATNLVKTN